MDLRMQRLDPPVHDLGRPGELRHLERPHPGRLQGLRRPPGRKDFHPRLSQGFGKFHNAGFVGNRDQRALDFHVEPLPFTHPKPGFQSSS